MAAVRKGTEPVRPRRPPGKTPEAREKQLIALAVDVVEKQMRDGTASSQVLTHYLKLGSSREMLEQERLRHENELLQAKAEAMAEQKKMGEMYEKALTAMSIYQGHEAPVEEIYE
jgi:putative cell wall-binding protein